MWRSRRGADQAERGWEPDPLFPCGIGLLAASRGERRHSRRSARQGRGERCCAAAAGPSREGGEACRGHEGASPDPTKQESLRGERAGGNRGPRGLCSRGRPGAGGRDGGGRGGSIRFQGHQALLRLRGPARGPRGRVGARPGGRRREASEGSACILLVGCDGGGGS